ncbi:methyltransferase domain-containing protein [Phenylobacterium sp.]|uniref:methyltransferase domain-containing protein n=1 Tax=Phenylobacterium sp. TaxID=1871053 RepID=UPI002896AF42|nr:methyltransferase domain-containing protein [Phenylobacterium sp.]
MLDSRRRRALLGKFDRRFGAGLFLRFLTTEPVSRRFGYDRGTPIDRYYIENFLRRNAADISGRALEIGDASYCRQFGGAQVTRQEVLHVKAGNPEATIVGDLSEPGVLPEGGLDCIVLTQTLHLIYDMKAAVEGIWRGLKPGGGVALVTVPGISPVAEDEWGTTWYWSLTALSAKRLFGEVFGPENVEVETFGNAFSATAFLQGLAHEEVSKGKLDVVDDGYPVTITIRARRA